MLDIYLYAKLYIQKKIRVRPGFSETRVLERKSELNPGFQKPGFWKNPSYEKIWDLKNPDER